MIIGRILVTAPNDGGSALSAAAFPDSVTIKTEEDFGTSEENKPPVATESSVAQPHEAAFVITAVESISNDIKPTVDFRTSWWIV